MGQLKVLAGIAADRVNILSNLRRDNTLSQKRLEPRHHRRADTRLDEVREDLE
jgi:hypothetical protein